MKNEEGLRVIGESKRIGDQAKITTNITGSGSIVEIYALYWYIEMAMEKLVRKIADKENMDEKELSLTKELVKLDLYKAKKEQAEIDVCKSETE